MEKFYLKIKKNYFYILLGVMMFIPLYPKFPLLTVPGTYVAVRIEDIFIGLLSIFWFFINKHKVTRFLKQPIYQSFILFWAIGGLSLLSALLLTYFVAPHLGFLHWFRRIEYMMLFVIAATTISSVVQIKTILKVGLIVNLIIVLYGFGQQWLRFPVISTTNREFSKGLVLFLTDGARVNSTFAGHYDLAIFLTIVLTLLISLFFYHKTILSRSLIALSGLLSFALLGMTAARVSFFTTLAGLILSLWLSKKKLLIVLIIFAGVGMVGVLPELRHRLVATFTVNFLGGGGPKFTPGEKTQLDPATRLSEASRMQLLNEAIRSGHNIATVASDIAPGEPLNPTELGVHRSYGIRLDVEWPRALRAFYKNPFLGTGYSSLNIATDNDFLRALGETGLLGTLALILIFFILVKKMIRFIKTNEGFEKAFVIGIFCSLSAVLLTGLFIDVLEASKVAIILWFLLGVTWALITDFKDSKD